MTAMTSPQLLVVMATVNAYDVTKSVSYKLAEQHMQKSVVSEAVVN